MKKKEKKWKQGKTNIEHYCYSSVTATTKYMSHRLTKKMEMLSCNCSEWSPDKAYIPCPTVTVDKWCQTVMQACVTKNVVTGLTPKNALKIEQYTNILASHSLPIKSHLIGRSIMCRSNKLKLIPPNHGLNCTSWSNNKNTIDSNNRSNNYYNPQHEVL